MESRVRTAILRFSFPSFQESLSFLLLMELDDFRYCSDSKTHPSKNPMMRIWGLKELEVSFLLRQVQELFLMEPQVVCHQEDTSLQYQWFLSRNTFFRFAIKLIIIKLDFFWLQFINCLIKKSLILKSLKWFLSDKFGWIKKKYF